MNNLIFIYSTQVYAFYSLYLSYQIFKDVSEMTNKKVPISYFKSIFFILIGLTGSRESINSLDRILLFLRSRT